MGSCCSAPSPNDEEAPPASNEHETPQPPATAQARPDPALSSEPATTTNIVVQIDKVDEKRERGAVLPSPPSGVGQGEDAGRLVAAAEESLAVETRSPEERYDVGKELGRGCFGVVKVCRERSSGEEFALKIMSKSSLKNASIVQDEVRQLRKVGQHPNVVQMHDFFEDANGFYIVMEYCRGGDLFSRIVSVGSYSETMAARLLQQLARAIQHMHRNKIAHRDLKPENLLLMSGEPDSPLKVVDFGLSKFVNTPQGMMNTVIGTWAYCAPEVFSRKPYTEKVDNWALGVLMFIMLAGYHPFDVFGDANEPMLIDNICKGRYGFTEPEWQNISQEAQDIISQLLRSDPNARMGVEAFLASDWVNGRTAPTSPLEQSQKRLQLRISTKK